VGQREAQTSPGIIWGGTQKREILNFYVGTKNGNKIEMPVERAILDDRSCKPFP